MQILKKKIDNAFVLYALDKNEDMLLLAPAKEHLLWLCKRMSTRVFDVSMHGSTLGALNELKKIDILEPILIEIISHGALTCDVMGSSSTDAVKWSDVAATIVNLSVNREIVVNAMSTCFSFPLVDALCSQIPMVFGSNLASSPNAFSHIELLYTNGIHAINNAALTNQYTWCIERKKENNITSQERYKILEARHKDETYWKDWVPKLKSLAGLS